MNATARRAVLIEKELLNQIQFPSGEVLASQEQIINRKANLDRALILGNLDHNKVRIVFVDSEGPKMVETTIWAVTDSRIILKSGMIIPINRIMEIVT